MNSQANSKIMVRLKEWRELRGFTLLSLSRAAGVNRSNLYQIEAGNRRAIDFEVLEKLAKTLNINPSQLISP